MKLHTLKRSKGIVSKMKRIGRGNGSGKGNYSTKGLKGQKARSGSSTRPFFEGGQTSIVQRIPKAKGFKRYFKLIKDFIIVNLETLDLDHRITDGMEITKKILKDLRYIKNENCLVKILGNGTWTKKITFEGIDSFSKSAQEKIANPSAAWQQSKKSPKIEKETSKTPAKKSAAKKSIVKEETPKSMENTSTEKEAVEIEGSKPAAKKPAAKKAPAAKKVAAEKPAAKKPAVKKTPAKKETKKE